MPNKRLFRLAYHTSENKEGRFRFHQLRDGDAFVQLSPLLYERGYTFGGLLLNLPAKNRLQATHFDLAAFTSSDLIMLDTRPPMDDLDQKDNRRVPRSYNNLEDSIFEALRPYFKKCARSRIWLSETAAQNLPDAFKNRADIVFKENVDASYKRFREYDPVSQWEKPQKSNMTAVFLIQVDELWEKGPGLLAVFGMTGTDTLVWHYLLRTRYPQWVGSSRFLMIEMETQAPPLSLTNLSFADDWKLSQIIQIP